MIRDGYLFFYHSKYICINFQNIIGPFKGSINRYPKTERDEGHKFLYEKPSLACQVLIIRIYKLFHKSFKFINSLSLHLVPDAKWGKKPKNATRIICLIFVISYPCLPVTRASARYWFSIHEQLVYVYRVVYHTGISNWMITIHLKLSQWPLRLWA